ncbi:uncharacterized protein LOC135246537 [Anguilla rostrata]|uniref:uncharacterized protein LOC135246537 n=1 Tax=Anguilla rostrata TaxID=7938 RepID=UPI0030D146AC
MWKFSTVLLLLALPPSVNSKETPTPRMCAVCLDKDCATGVSEIYPPDSDTAIWPKANSQTGIQNCSMENLKADAPCKMANGSLVQLADETLRFEGTNPPNIRRIFHSQSFPCADLINSKPSPVTKAPNIAEAYGIDSIIDSIIGSIGSIDTDTAIGIGIGIIIGGGIVMMFIGILIGFFIGKRKSCGQGQDRVPAHDPEDRNENTMEMQRLNVEDANENVNRVHREDDSVGPEGYLDDSPV